MAGFWSAPVAAGHEGRRKKLTHLGRQAKKHDAVQQGVDSWN
jgi:hypothetical protein